MPCSCPGAAAVSRRVSPAAWLRRSAGTRVYACEPETGAPVTAALAAGEPGRVEFQPSWVDGAGSKALLPPMWQRAQPLLAGAFALPLDDVAAAVRLLAERVRVIAEGAGALSVAAALSGRVDAGRIVCIVSGGNIDSDRLAAILAGRAPD